MIRTGDHLGKFDEEWWSALVKAFGNMMDSDCEPV
jgi:hypothetical protein